MPGDNTNRWKPAQLSDLRTLRAAGVPWPEVALEVGHPVTSCRQKMTDENNARRRAAAKATNASLREAADRRAKPPPPIPHPSSLPLVQRSPVRGEGDFVRSSAVTAKLIMDAELRARIEILGATGGLLGDPLPGRSALDQKRQGSP